MTSLFDLGALNVKRADSKAEDIEWLQLDDGAYLSAGYPELLIIELVAVPDISMAGVTILWVG